METRKMAIKCLSFMTLLTHKIAEMLMLIIT